MPTSQNLSASIAVEMINKWDLLRAQSNRAWESYPSYFEICVPRMVEVFEANQIAPTLFVTHQDAQASHHELIWKTLVEGGAEVAILYSGQRQHLHTMNLAQLQETFERTEESIENAVGAKPVGFRNADFHLSKELLQTLIRRGYQYDSTSYPTFLGPIKRLTHIGSKAFFSDDPKANPDLLPEDDTSPTATPAFRPFSDGLEPNQAYHWSWRGRNLVELPRTTMPFFKTPFDFTSILRMAQTSKTMAKLYWQATLRICHFQKIEPTITITATDFVGGEDDLGLKKCHTLNMSAEEKISLLNDCLAMLARQFDIVTLTEHAQRSNRWILPARAIEQVPSSQATELARETR